MLLENKSGQPQEFLLLPISNSAIKASVDQIIANPKLTFLEDLKEIRLKQPIIRSIVDNVPFDKKDLDVPSYTFGITRAFRFFRNQADQNGFELPEIPENCLGILRESIREDERLKSFNQYHLPSVDKIAIDLREDQYDLWMAFQQIFTKTTHYQSFMKGILSVVFLFKTYQENDHFERLLEA